jgi:acetoin utilization deacetylase AcuC-like enzyme
VTGGPPVSALAYCLVPSPEHTLEGHAEHPERFSHLEQAVASLPADAVMRVEPQPADEESLLAVHPERYLRALEAACMQGPAYVDYAPTYVTPHSITAACLAAGGTLKVLDEMLAGRARTALALVRPPGHHATATRAMGFCLLNNAAVAARAAQRAGHRRILIIDVDLHHGNGTQAIFESDPDVLYVSTHQAGIYPGSGALEETGIEQGVGATVNIPLYPHCGDETFARLTDQILVPLARRFVPDMLFISAGFDSHWRDPLGQLQLTCAGYSRLASTLGALADELCGGRVLVVLEGGYDAEALAAGVLSVACALAGLPARPDPLGAGGYLEPDMSPLLERVRQTHGL